MTAPDPILSLRLPGNWWEVPLDDRDAARASLRRLARTQLGSADSRAADRIAIEQRTLAALERAIAGDGQFFYVALSIVPGARISLNAIVASPDEIVPHQPDPSLAPTDILQRVVERGRDSGDPPLVRVRSKAGIAVRRVRYAVEEIADPGLGDGRPVRESRAAFEYWFAQPETRRLVVATFSAPAGPLEKELMGLCDQIVAASDWRVPARA